MMGYFLLGLATGMRTMTAIAVLCWAAWLRLVPQSGWGRWTGYLVSALVFTGFAVAEYYGDTRPHTPNRTSAGGFIPRLVFGALVGALAANALTEPLAGGILFGLLGASVGTWGGLSLRTRAAAALGRDLPVALAESAAALLLSIATCSGMHSGLVLDFKRGIV